MYNNLKLTIDLCLIKPEFGIAQQNELWFEAISTASRRAGDLMWPRPRKLFTPAPSKFIESKR